MREVLVLSYSNSGDVEVALARLLAPLQGRADTRIHHCRIRTVEPINFPWTVHQFAASSADVGHAARLDVVLDPPPPNIDFDLVVLGWQVWWLRPSPPIRNFLQRHAHRLLGGRRVIAIGCSRQMWVSAYLRLQRLVAGAGGILSDQAMVRYQGSGATLITTPMMLLTGKRRAFGPFPPPTPIEEELRALDRCGERLAASDRWRTDLDTPLLGGVSLCRYEARYRVPEKVASAFMSVCDPVLSNWARRGQPLRWPLIYLWAILFAIGVATVVPAWLLLTLCYPARSKLRDFSTAPP
jgi:hypothetical protein